MFLRPVKSAAQCVQSQRKYDVVWLQQEVCYQYIRPVLTCLCCLGVYAARNPLPCDIV